jgi:hypothetical protein
VFFEKKLVENFSTPKNNKTSTKAANKQRYLKCLSFKKKLGGLMLWNKSQNHGEVSKLHYHKHLVHLQRKNKLAPDNMPHYPLS